LVKALSEAAATALMPEKTNWAMSLMVYVFNHQWNAYCDFIEAGRQ